MQEADLCLRQRDEKLNCGYARSVRNSVDTTKLSDFNTTKNHRKFSEINSKNLYRVSEQVSTNSIPIFFLFFGSSSVVVVNLRLFGVYGITFTARYALALRARRCCRSRGPATHSSRTSRLFTRSSAAWIGMDANIIHIVIVEVVPRCCQARLPWSI
jgi:hypothetical protein